MYNEILKPPLYAQNKLYDSIMHKIHLAIYHQLSQVTKNSFYSINKSDPSNKNPGQIHTNQQSDKEIHLINTQG